VRSHLKVIASTMLTFWSQLPVTQNEKPPRSVPHFHDLPKVS